MSDSSRSRKRMTGAERREQLIQIGRTLFAEKGFDGTSVEEIAASAQVSKPVVYEHFGGKEGIYAVVIDREMQRLLSLVTQALVASHARVKLERAALALLQYIEESSEGFQILVRDSHAASGTGTFASLISDIAAQVENVLADEFRERGYDPGLAPMYAQMLVGMTALTGQWWLEERRPPREEVAAHLVNLSWNGLTGLDPNPGLTSASRGLVLTPAVDVRPPPVRPPSERELKEQEKARREQEKAREREIKDLEKAREREQREQEKAREREIKEQDKIRREQEKAREREIKDLEKAREREQREQEKAREREEKELERAREREQKERDRQREREERELQRAQPESRSRGPETTADATDTETDRVP
ncbi:TetR/AcrR family transcriptional regulator [Planotetraspora phitsanulokensis]|uniref:TetR/AcrR family transcriptional regulator n=1 Tax=Planotetraspora phitsanulokensis TaxID=575192 RepID=UPI001EF3A063|nr:TetR/AcrR family transcriptional regulator [Planotetraspora phitsanulokensis]